MLHTSTATLTRAVELLNDSKNGILLIQSDSVSEYDQIVMDWSYSYVHRKIVDSKKFLIISIQFCIINRNGKMYM